MKNKRRPTCRNVIEITDGDGKRTAYAVRPIVSEFPEHRRAYQVRKLSEPDTVYHVTQESSGQRSCDCPKGEWTQRSCRHTLALAAAGLFLSTKELAALNRMEQTRGHDARGTQDPPAPDRRPGR